MKERCVLFMLCMMFLVGCAEQNEVQEKPVTEESAEEIESSIMIEEETEENKVQAGRTAPAKEDVLAMREKVLDGMTDDEKERLTENIKIANLQMERAYLNDNLFEKLEDKDSPYWQYFDKAGDIQLGWWYKQQIMDKDAIMQLEGITETEFDEREYEPGIVYNRFDGENFVELLQDMQKSVHDDQLYADLKQLIDLTNLAVETHEVEYAADIYKILHDMDYFLLRYGIEDVGKYTQDKGTVSKYYGVLTVYQNEGNGKKEVSANSIEEINEYKIPEQSFDVSLDDWGEVMFVSCRPSPLSEDVFEDVSFFLVKDNQVLYRFPDLYENNSSGGHIGLFDSVGAVDFRDLNEDSKKDIIVITYYVTGAGPTGMVPRPAPRIFLAGENEFYLAEDMMTDVEEHITEKDITIENICDYLKNKKD